MTKPVTSAPFGGAIASTNRSKVPDQSYTTKKQQQQRRYRSSSLLQHHHQQFERNPPSKKPKISSSATVTSSITTLPSPESPISDSNSESRQQVDEYTTKTNGTVVTPNNTNAPPSSSSAANVDSTASAAASSSSSFPAAYDRSLYARMNVSKEIVDELLLVCGVIGTTVSSSSSMQYSTETNTTDTTASTIIPVTDCLNWLQDLQRLLRRDDDTVRSISLLVGQYKIVQTKLLPLILQCRYDTNIIITLCKILVILTKPLNEMTVRAGQVIINTHSKKDNEAVIKEQIKLRENALQQVDTLMEYKRLFCYHPSHISSNGNGLLSVFVSLLAEPLSRTGASRTDSDHLIIELTLHLFRNLLSIEPILHTSSSSRETAALLHCELISLLEQELVLDIILVLGADIELRENSHYNLLLMELMHHLLRNQDPAAVASCSTKRKTVISHQSSRHKNGSKSLDMKDKQTQQQQSYRHAGAGRLTEGLFREQQRKAAAATNRHSHFAGTIRLDHTLGGSSKSQYVSAAMILGNSNNSTHSIGKGNVDRVGYGGGLAGRRSTTTKRIKMLEPFVGSTTNTCNQCHTNIIRFPLVDGNNSSLTRQRAYRTLDKFCQRFLEDCYGPVMKSLKNEFRRDSARLEDNDTTVLFRIIWFFCQWYRLSDYKKQQKKQFDVKDVESEDKGKSTSIGSLIFTMDVFTYNLVLTSIESFQILKKYTRLAQGVALLCEMMHLLYEMFTSSTKNISHSKHSHDSAELNTEHVMALGLMDRLFYGDEPLDNLPKLVSKWSPGSNTREHLCNIVELCYMTLKLLDTNARSCTKEVGISDNNDGNKVDDIDKADSTESSKHGTITKMKKRAMEFNVNTYFGRKIVGSNFISACTNLLSMYEVNAPTVNHRLIALLTRVCKHVVSRPEDTDYDNINTNGTGSSSILINKVVTLEPILYNIQMLTIFNSILSDTSIRTDKDYSIVINFASAIVYNFAVAATGTRATSTNTNIENNPLIFVEALFKHPNQYRYCENVTNMYITEELRMLVDRETLREETARIMSNSNEDEEEDDEIAIQDEYLEDDQCDKGTGDLNQDDVETSDTSTTLGTEKTKQIQQQIIDDSDDDELQLE